MLNVTLSLLLASGAPAATPFTEEAPALAAALKGGLVKGLTEAIQKDGPEQAIAFCQANVAQLAKTAAGEKAQRYTFGRTSHKVRNPKNAAEPWVEPYLKRLAGKSKDDVKETHFLVTLADKKQAWLEPLWVQPMCTTCHGETLAPGVAAKVKALYPADAATGFKAGEFRGFLWIREK